MRAMCIVGSVLVACGSTSVPTGSIDAAVGTGGSSGSNSGSGTNVVDDVVCQTHTSSLTGSNGTRTVTDSHFALIDSISAGDDFAVEQCDEAETFTYYGSDGSVTGTNTINFNKPGTGVCPAGYTCTDSGAPYPAVTHACSWTKYGTFWDGKLYISCGSNQKSYSAQGVQLSAIDLTFGAIRIHH